MSLTSELEWEFVLQYFFPWYYHLNSVKMYLCEWKSVLLWKYYLLREGWTSAAIGQWPVTSGDEAGRIGLIGVLFSGSLRRDQDRQLCGGLTGTDGGLPRTHTHDLQVSHGSRSYLRRENFELIHPQAFKGEIKTLYRVWGAVEFDRTGCCPL